MNRAWLVAAGAILAGCLFMWLTIDLPHARGGLLYARTTLHLMSGDISLSRSMSDYLINYGKGVGLPWMAVPVARWVGADLALRLLSSLGGAAFIVASVLLMRRFNRVLGAGQDRLWLQALIVVFNPLTLHQFWAAYSDVWLAAGFVTAVYAADVYIRESGIRVGALLVFVAASLFSIFMRIYGAITLVAAFAIAVSVGRPLWKTREGRVKLAILGVLAGALGMFVLTSGVAASNVVMTAENGKAEGTDIAKWWMAPLIPVAAVLQGLAFLLVTVSVFAPRLFRAASYPRALRTVLPSAIAYLLPLFLLWQTLTNMRFFMPLLPFMAVVLERSLAQLPAPRLFTAWVVVQSVFIANENVPLVQRAAWSVNAALRRQTVYAGLFDNLRLHDQMRAARAFERINHEIPKGAVLYIVSDYYADSLVGLHKRLGTLRRDDLDIRYRPNLKAVEPVRGQVYWLYALDEQSQFKQIRKRGEKEIAEAGLGRATQLGEDLFRVEHEEIVRERPATVPSTLE